MTPEPGSHDARVPDARDVRAALERILASEQFRASAQLAAFLRFVVEAALRGEGDRIKGYTIAVEALGRDERFDPQADPIVRVEAARLRRALAQYYAAGGTDDTIEIELPRGSYVPVFRTRTQPAQSGTARAQARAVLARAALSWQRVAVGLALVLAGAALYALIDAFSSVPEAVAPSERAAAGAWRQRHAVPLVFVSAVGSAGARRIPDALAAALHGKLRDALARFDEVNVVAEPPPRLAGRARAAGNDGVAARGYEVAISAEEHQDGSVSLTFRLIDAADGALVWTRTFGNQRFAAGSSLLENAIVREVAATAAQPYGIIGAWERSKFVAAANVDARYVCMMEAFDYWRHYQPPQHARARDCLERVLQGDPGFALGYATLAPLYLDEYRNGFNVRPGEPPPLDRALQAARRAVELKPGSARAYQTLLDTHFIRRDYKLALEAGEKAVALNPYDPDIMADYGARLLAFGQVEQGTELLNEASTLIIVRPAWHDFYLFLGAYLRNDYAGAARYASLITSDTFPLGLMARALIAAQRGDEDLSKRTIERLVQVAPGWRDAPRRELEKFFPATAIVERLARDLARIGLGVMN